MDLINCIRRFFGHLPEPDISPGEWFRDYRRDWAAAHYIPEFAIDDCITTGIVEGKNGWIYATDTPSWDRDWWEASGFRFPSRWVTFSSLADYQGTAGDYLKLDI